ncbi:MAG: transcription elongation factor subunit Spt4 [Candidatus Verstraetearchaeota archaeon]|nr:transcription elongation factor subunit Spt4 [Candidatus Verstraetearchaeota archaeon]
MKQLACRKCKFITSGEEKRCPVCGGSELSDEWSGLVIILDVNSKLAEMIGAKREGRYAIKVR